MRNAYKIWQAYKMIGETSFVMRGGTTACEVLKEIPLDNLYEKAEMVAEHQLRSAWLMGQILMNFPSLLPREEWFDQVMFLMTHDVGEIRLGDQLDDGSGMREQAAAIEKEVTDEFYGWYPKADRERYKEKQARFERYEGQADGLAKGVDKLEAVLYLLLLETKGIRGSILAKEHPSKRDIKIAEQIGSYCCTDVWATHLRKAWQMLDFGVRNVILYQLMEVGFSDARSGVLPYCLTCDIDTIDIEV